LNRAKGCNKNYDGSQQQEWWRHCKRVCGLQSSGRRKLKVACNKIDGIVARGRLDRAEGYEKNERWFATTRLTASLQEGARHTIMQPGRKAYDGRVAIGREDELVHLMGPGNGMRQLR
jgi:hypothetical protein